MTALTSTPSVQALAWALVHFLWQGAAIAVLVILWLRAGRPTAQARYAGGVAALAALLLAPIATFTWHAVGASSAPAVPPPSVESGGAAPDVVDAPVPPVTPADLRDLPPAALPSADIAAVGIVAAWTAGVLLFSLRLAGGWILARRLAGRGAAPAPAEVCTRGAALSRRLGLTRAVRIVESTAVTVPVLVGWMKPVVLFPAAAFSGLSAAQVEALIAHELAHVRRHDYLVNILQSLVETLLFYHPAVWIVSRDVREAREQCCDDLAIAVCDPVVYVSALADLAEMNRAPRMALAATGGSLLGRVQRLLGQPHERSGPGMASLGVLTLALVLGGALPPAIEPAASTDAIDGDARRDVRLRAAEEATLPGQGDAPDRPLLDRVQQTPRQSDQAVAAPVDLGARPNVQGTVLMNCRVHPDGAVSDCDVRGTVLMNCRVHPDGAVSDCDVQGTVLVNCGVHADGTVSDCEALRSLASTFGVDEKLEARLADLERQVAAGRAALQRDVARSTGAADLQPAVVEARAARVRAEVDAADAHLARVRQLHDRGLVASPVLRDAEERLAAALRELLGADG